MTQEEKELLLKELSARLRYNVRLEVKNCRVECNHHLLGVDGNLIKVDHYQVKEGCGEYPIFIDNWMTIEECKPYLRPMSSMTEEEKNYIKNIARFKQPDGIHYDDGVHYIPIYQETLDDQWKTDGKLPPILGDIYRFMLDYGYILLIDFFNSRHLDYRGLITMGLALEAPKDMYVVKN